MLQNTLKTHRDKYQEKKRKHLINLCFKNENKTNIMMKKK